VGNQGIRQSGGNSVEKKIFGALEKISHVLRFLAWKKATELALTPIQLQILIYLLRGSPERGKVGLLAREFNISKASISDTIRLMVDKKLVEKSFNGTGGRDFIIELTPMGVEMANKAAQMDAEILNAITRILPAGRTSLFSRLGEILLDLQRAAVMPVQRMCQTCHHYSTMDNKHFCGLLERSMRPAQLQLDCPEHQMSARP